MTVPTVRKKEFGCPNCGGRKMIQSSGLGYNVLTTFDEKGVAVENVELRNGFRLNHHTPICANLHCGVRFVDQHWQPEAPQKPDPSVVHEMLVELAVAGGSTTYRDLSLMYKRTTGFFCDHHMSWGPVLGALADIALSKNEPMLSALVCTEEKGMPGPGFFWNKLGCDPQQEKVCWQAWKTYKRKLHRYYYNQRFRPWRVKPMRHQ